MEKIIDFIKKAVEAVKTFFNKVKTIFTSDLANKIYVCLGIAVWLVYLIFTTVFFAKIHNVLFLIMGLIVCGYGVPLLIKWFKKVFFQK